MERVDNSSWGIDSECRDFDFDVGHVEIVYYVSDQAQLICCSCCIYTAVVLEISPSH